MIHFKDLRSYLSALEAIGEVQRIKKPVALDLEIGAISRRAGETGQAAPLFEMIPERPGFRVLGAPGGVSSKPGQWLARIALALGLPAEATGRQIVEQFAAARERPLIPPKVVATGPCKENIHVGDQIDLMELPAPLLHDGDGGRYLNTFGIICCETPTSRGGPGRSPGSWWSAASAWRGSSPPTSTSAWSARPGATSARTCPTRSRSARNR